MEEVTKKTTEKRERPQNKNLSKTGGPGRPVGQRNYATIYREALIKIANANNKTPEEIEEMMEEVGIKQGLKGNFAFWKDIRDRIHGKPVQDITTGGRPLPTPIIPLHVIQGDDSNKKDRGSE